MPPEFFNSLLKMVLLSFKYPHLADKICTYLHVSRASQVALVVKDPPANAGDRRDTGSFLGWGRSPGGGQGNPLQHSCLENPMDRGAWQATVHRVAKSQTQFSIHACTHMLFFFALNSLPLFFSLLLNWIPELGSSAPKVFHSFIPSNPIRVS